MSEPPRPSPAELAAGLVAVGLAGAALDVFALLLLPLRVRGHLVPAGPLLALAVNAGLSLAGGRLLASPAPARLLLALAIGVSVAAVGTGPGGDVLVTTSLQTNYLLYVAGALLGAGVPLLARRTP